MELVLRWQDKMGMIDKKFQKALDKGRNSVNSSVEKVTNQQQEIIEKLNWVMETQQEIANHLKIKLKDPLEED